MKIADRYVLGAFLKNYLLSLAVLIGLYIVLHMVVNFDELVEVGDSAAGSLAALGQVVRSVVDFYFYQSFLIFSHLAGVIPVVAASFTLLRMSRENELTALLAAGVPMLRIALPVLVAGAALNLALLPLVQEAVIPRIIPKLLRAPDQIAQQSTRSYPIRALQDETNALLLAARYTPGGGAQTPRMEHFDLIERNERFEPVAHVAADAAEWDATHKRWTLSGGVRTVHGGPGRAVEGERPVAYYQSNVTPDEIALHRSGDYVELLSTARINQLLQRPQAVGVIDLLRVKHQRFTQPLLNVVLLLLAVSCALIREPGRLKRAATRLLALSAAAMATAFVCQNLAGSPPPEPQWLERWPLLMGWLPIFVFGPLGLVLLDRVKT